MKVKDFITGLFILLAIGAMLTSCKKDSFNDCNCGIITDDHISGSSYSLQVRNECTGNKQWFEVDGDVWLHGYIGNNQCFTNQSNW